MQHSCRLCCNGVSFLTACDTTSMGCRNMGIKLLFQSVRSINVMVASSSSYISPAASTTAKSSLKGWNDWLGHEVPHKVDIVFDDITVEAEVRVGQRMPPTLLNAVINGAKQFHGKVTYNGESCTSTPHYLCAYVSQYDLHHAEMTVRETIGFASNMLGANNEFGEMLVGRARCFFMDDVSTGLDSSTTFEIMTILRQMAHLMDHTMVISLLQPAPETYELFDHVFSAAIGSIHDASNVNESLSLPRLHWQNTDDLQPWLSWGSWASPFTYSLNAVALNEFLDNRWATVFYYDSIMKMLKNHWRSYPEVYESLQFSAYLRLPSDCHPHQRDMFIEEVMELVELTNLRDAIVGTRGVTGLSAEQRKRLTVAVELVASPSIIFMDEPTSGLDARAAAIVMRTVRKTVNTGRTVVCTIHQPSIEIFESFDEVCTLSMYRFHQPEKKIYKKSHYFLRSFIVQNTYYSSLRVIS
ncbi:hypothetical protein PR202_ga16843 [Eleusine coracana subsp. coracana]|uniref:ABC transporter domain-containing protein n=1 Tax=Eleusine coracana subsp. coracana TaxID=191504 RepID=A0AAV5CMK7_ELECO|nr:hypothetical protein PR202_ga16843 [Eleusine coracana subsp. coracana]